MGKSLRDAWLTMIVVVLLRLSVMMRGVGADSFHRPMRCMEPAQEYRGEGPDPSSWALSAIALPDVPQLLPMVVRDVVSYTANTIERNEEIQDEAAAYRDRLTRMKADIRDLLQDFGELRQIAAFLGTSLEQNAVLLRSCEREIGPLTEKLAHGERVIHELLELLNEQEAHVEQFRAKGQSTLDGMVRQHTLALDRHTVSHMEAVTMLENSHRVTVTDLKNTIRSLQVEKDKTAVAHQDEVNGLVENLSIYMHKLELASVHTRSCLRIFEGLQKDAEDMKQDSEAKDKAMKKLAKDLEAKKKVVASCEKSIQKVKDLERDLAKKDKESQSKDQLVSKLKKELEVMKITESARAQSIAELQEKVNLRQLFNNFRNSVIGRLYDRRYLLDFAKKTQIDEIQRRDIDRRQARSSKGSKSKEGSYLYLADIRILEDKHLFSSVVITLVDEKTRLRKMLNAASTPQKNKPQLERDISSLNNQIKALKKVAAHLKPTDEEVEKAGGFAWSTKIGEAYAQWCMYTAEANEACHPDVSGNELLKSIKIRAQEGRYIHNNHDMKDIIVAVIDRALQDDGQEFNE